MAHGKYNTLHSREVQALFPIKGVVGCRIFRVGLLDHKTGLPNDPGGPASHLEQSQRHWGSPACQDAVLSHTNASAVVMRCLEAIFQGHSGHD